MSILSNELTSGPLAAELAPLIAAGNDGAIVEVLNRKDIPAKGRLPVRNIYRYLTLVGLRVMIAEGQSDACKVARYALEDLQPEIDLSNPVYLDKFTEILDALIADTATPDFTAGDKAALLGMGNVLISRAEQLGVAPSENDIAVARMEIS